MSCTMPEKCLASSVEWINLWSLSQTKENTFNPQETVREQLNTSLYATNTCCREERQWCGLKLEKVFIREFGIKEIEEWE